LYVLDTFIFLNRKKLTNLQDGWEPFGAGGTSFGACSFNNKSTHRTRARLSRSWTAHGAAYHALGSLEPHRKRSKRLACWTAGASSFSPTVFLVTEAAAAAIRVIFEQEGELLAAIRRHAPVPKLRAFYAHLSMAHERPGEL
jgi:hypothetical protein